MRNKFFFCLICLTISVHTAYAEESSDRIDPLSQNFMTVQVNTATPGFSLDLANSDGNKTVSFAPNLTSTYGVSVAFTDYIGGSVAFHGAADPNQASKGQTSYDDFRFTFDFKNCYVEALYQRYNGLYVSNSVEVDPSAKSNILAPNMSMQNISLNYTYAFQPKNFSILAALSRTARQIRSGGSWLLGGSFIQTTISNTAGLLPQAIRSQFGPDQNITDVRSRSLSTKGGYGYTFAITDKSFITLLGDLGLGWGDSTFNDSLNSFHVGFTSILGDAKIIMAYNGDSVICGISGDTQTILSKTNSMDIHSSPTLTTLFLGTRF